MSLYPLIYASLITMAFVAATAYAIGRGHDARKRTEAFRLGWRRGVEWQEERDLRRRVAHVRGGGSGNGGVELIRRAVPYGGPRWTSTNERRVPPLSRPTVPLEEAVTMDLAGRRP